MASPLPGHITRLFSRWRSGDDNSRAELLSHVYEELRRLAGFYLRGERAGHTLQATELVNEAFLRLVGAEVEANDRNHFFALAAQSMRRILVDHARRKVAAKRFDAASRVTLVTCAGAASGHEIEVLDLSRALDRLVELAPRPARVVELRYFGGLTLPEAASVLGISRATAARDWEAARIWLAGELET